MPVPSYRFGIFPDTRVNLDANILQYRLSPEPAEWRFDFTHNQNITPDGLTQLSGHGSLVSSKILAQYSQDSSELQQQLITFNLSFTRQFQTIRGSGSVV